MSLYGNFPWGQDVWGLIGAEQDANPIWLVEISLDGVVTPLRFSTQDVVVNGVFYVGAIMSTPSLSKSLSDLYWGIATKQDITFSFVPEYDYDVIPSYDSWVKILADYEVRGIGVKLLRYGQNDGTTFEAYGIITSYNLLDSCDITMSLGEFPEMRTMLPLRLCAETDFADDRPKSAMLIRPASGQGKAYPLLFGRCRKVPLIPIYFKYTETKYFDYIIGYGPIQSVETVYRNKRVVNATEYEFHDGSASPYQGYAFIRFPLEQKDSGGSEYELCADVNGLLMGGVQAERSPVRIIQNLLTNSSWGLGGTVNEVYFNAAQQECSNLYVDGYVDSQKSAQDTLNELLSLCRGALDRDANGHWIISVDMVAKDYVSASFGSGDDFWENIINISSNSKTAYADASKKFVLKYKIDPWKNEYRCKIEYQALPFGEERIIESAFIRDHVMADMLCQLRQKEQTYGDHKIEFSAGIEARHLMAGNVISVNVPRLGISGSFMVESASRQGPQVSIKARSYSQDMYSYTMGVLPDDPYPDSVPDYSNTPPGIPTSPIVGTTGTSQGTDGTTVAYANVSSVPPPFNFSYMKFGYRKVLEAIFNYVDGTSSGGTWSGRYDGLVPGMNYEFIATALNSSGQVSSSNIITHVAVGDTTAPATVQNVIGNGKYKTWTFSWDKNSEKDIRGYVIELSTSAGFASLHATKRTSANILEFTDESLPYGSLYARVKAEDFTGNLSASYSASASATTSGTGTPDIQSLAVDTTKLADGSVTAIKTSDLSADKISAGVLLVNTGSITSSSYGGDSSKLRDGQAHFYDKATPTPNSICTIGSPAYTGGTTVISVKSLANAGIAVDAYPLSNGCGIYVYNNSGLSGTAAIKGITGTNGTIGINGVASTNGYGVYGQSASGVGVYGTSTSGSGVQGNSTSGAGGYFSGGLYAIQTAAGQIIRYDGPVSATAGSLAAYLHINWYGAVYKLPAYNV